MELFESFLFIVCLILTIIAGVAAGFHLTTLMLLIVTLLSIFFWIYIEYISKKGWDNGWLFLCFISALIANIAMWATCLIATKPNWGWVGALFGDYIFRK